MKYELNKILTWIDEAEVIVIGGASGMSTANGYDYYTHHTPFFRNIFLTSVRFITSQAVGSYCITSIRVMKNVGLIWHEVDA